MPVTSRLEEIQKEITQHIEKYQDADSVNKFITTPSAQTEIKHISALTEEAIKIYKDYKSWHDLDILRSIFLRLTTSPLKLQICHMLCTQRLFLELVYRDPKVIFDILFNSLDRLIDDSGDGIRGVVEIMLKYVEMISEFNKSSKFSFLLPPITKYIAHIIHLIYEGKIEFSAAEQIETTWRITNLMDANAITFADTREVIGHIVGLVTQGTINLSQLINIIVVVGKESTFVLFTDVIKNKSPELLQQIFENPSPAYRYKHTAVELVNSCTPEQYLLGLGWSEKCTEVPVVVPSPSPTTESISPAIEEPEDGSSSPVVIKTPSSPIAPPSSPIAKSPSLAKVEDKTSEATQLLNASTTATHSIFQCFASYWCCFQRRTEEPCAISLITSR